MTDRTTILRRVRKLLALAAGKAEPREAEAAALAAQRLMQAHAVERAEVEERPGDVELDSFPYGRKVVTWKRDLAFAVARGFGCRCVHVPPSKASLGKAWLNFAGRAEDIAVAKEVYEWLRGELRRLCREYVRGATRFYDRRLRFGEAYDRWRTGLRRDFLAGAVYAIAIRLEVGAARHEAEHRALVRAGADRVEAFVREKFEKTEPAPAGDAVEQYAAWAAGRDAGAAVPLGEKPQVEKWQEQERT